MFPGCQSVRGRGCRGVTLVELIVTISVLLVVMTFGVTGLSTMIADNQRVTAVNSLMAMLNLARSEAIKRATDVTLCPAVDDDPTDAEKPCATSGQTDSQWERAGYVVLVGDTSTKNPPIIRIQPPPSSPGLTIRTSNRHWVTYQDDGSVTASSLATFRFCDSRSVVEGRAVVVGASGRARVQCYDCDSKSFCQ